MRGDHFFIFENKMNGINCLERAAWVLIGAVRRQPRKERAAAVSRSIMQGMNRSGQGGGLLCDPESELHDSEGER